VVGYTLSSGIISAWEHMGRKIKSGHGIGYFQLKKNNFDGTYICVQMLFLIFNVQLKIQQQNRSKK
jgi:NADH:ubiquinone oxidoreductase subunit 3 (subunit A)